MWSKILLISLLLGCIEGRVQGEVLHIYNWSDYMDLEVLKQFSAKTGVEIDYSFYDSNEELIKKLGQKLPCDVVFPSSHYVPRLAKDGLLKVLSPGTLDGVQMVKNTHFDKIPIIPYALPYFWGTTGLVIDEREGVKVEKWEDLWKPELKNKVMICEDMLDMFAICFKVLGIDVREKSETEIEKAYVKLCELIPNIKGFYSQVRDLKSRFLNRELVVAICYSGDVVELVQQVDFLNYKLPEDGALIWMDTIAVSAGAQNPQRAEEFIRYVLSQEILQKNGKKIGYATLRDAEGSRDLVIRPSDAVLAKGMRSPVVDENYPIYQKYWSLFLGRLGKDVQP